MVVAIGRARWAATVSISREAHEDQATERASFWAIEKSLETRELRDAIIGRRRVPGRLASQQRGGGANCV